MLADPNLLLRGALAMLLEATKDFTIVSAEDTCDRAVEACIRNPPHVAVLSLSLPGSPFEAARTIGARCDRCAIVFLSESSHAWYVEAAIDVGARAFVCTSDTPSAFVGALRSVAAGGCYFSQEVSSRVVVNEKGVQLRDAAQNTLSSLTPREVEVLRFVAQGLSKKQIADALHLSVKTIENHASSLMNRLEIHDRVGLTRLAIREGLVEP